MHMQQNPEKQMEEKSDLNAFGEPCPIMPGDRPAKISFHPTL